MDETYKFYALLLPAITLSIAAILTLNVPIIVITSFLLGCSIFVFKFWYIIDAYIFRHTNTILLFDGCELSGNRRAAIRQVGNRYVATAAAVLIGAPNHELDRIALEGVISRFKSTFRFITLVSNFNTNKILDALKTRRASKELSISHLLSETHPLRNSQKIESLKRDINVLDSEIKNLTSGSSPLHMANYVLTNAISESKSLASERACELAKRIAGELGAICGANVEPVYGTDLINLLKIDFGVIS